MNLLLFYNVEIHANVELYVNVELCGAASSNGPKYDRIWSLTLTLPTSKKNRVSV